MHASYIASYLYIASNVLTVIFTYLIISGGLEETV